MTTVFQSFGLGRTATLATVLFLAVVAACSADTGGTTPENDLHATESAYSIKVYVKHNGARDRIDIVPLQSTAPTAVTAGAVGTTNVKIQTLAGSAYDKALFLTSSNGAENLLSAAAAQCGMVGFTNGLPAIVSTDSRYDDLKRMFKNHQSVVTMTAVQPFTTANGWYIFPKRPGTCDQLLEYEETLLCIADKLGQVADAIAPVTWDNVRFIQKDGGASESEYSWTIPPQGDQDKFIARDLAISVLAHIPWLDGQTMIDPGVRNAIEDGSSSWDFLNDPGGDPFVTCSAYYSIYDRLTPAQQQGLAPMLWSSSSPNYPLDPTDVDVYAHHRGHARLQFQTNTLRASGMLLHDILNDSVYSDLAGMEHKKQQTSNPKAGAKAAWGSGSDPYNSLSHVARTLAGRLELPPFEDSAALDPSCNSVEPLDLLSHVGPSMAIRRNDVGALSGNEALAAALFEKSGLVLPPATPDLRGTLLAKLTAMRAASDAPVLATTLSTLSDADLARASERVNINFAAATNVEPTTLAEIQRGATKAGLAFTGGAITGGMTRGLATGGDPMAHVASMAAASQCRDGISTLEQADDLSTPARDRVKMQDAFTAAYALRARLVKMRETADPNPGDHPGPDVRARAAAVSELGIWAGTTQMILSNNSSELTLQMTGIAPEDYGVTRLEDVAGALSLVYGDSADAECVAGLRAACGDGAKAAVWKATGPATIVSTGDAVWRTEFGATGAVIKVHFAFDGNAPTALANAAGRAAALNAMPLYVVSAVDSNRPVGQGQILGALRPDTTAIVSPMRRTLADSAFGVGHWVGQAPPKVSENSMAQSPQYCVEGVSRDVFVPLDNDLTNDTDGYENSWSHYLDLARAAAARADDLGQTWVSIGFDRDKESESLQSTLMTGTGGYVDVDAVTVDQNGAIVPGATNGALAAVLNQSTLDIVFLTEDPFTSPTIVTPHSKEETDMLNAVLPCKTPDTPNVTSHPLCSRLASLTWVPWTSATLSKFDGKKKDPNVINYAALGLAPSAPATTGSMKQCFPIVNLASNVKGLPSPFTDPGVVAPAPQAFTASALQNALGGTWMKDVSGVNAQLSHLQMRVEKDGNWVVKSGGAIIMSTTPVPNSPAAPYWPACLNPTNPACDAKDPLAKAWSSMFRRCAADSLTSALGTCEGGDLQAETNMLRWRIEGAMWLAATMTGGVPQDMFDVPMPAVTLAGEGGDYCAPISHIFANGSFDAAANLTGVGPGIVEFSALQDNPDQRPPSPIDPSFHHWGPNVVEELPAETRMAYQQPIPDLDATSCITKNQYLAHVFGSNVAGRSDFSNLADFFAKHLGTNELDTASLNVPALLAIGAHIQDNGAKCDVPSGDFPGGTDLKAGWLQGLVASLKTLQATSSEMRAPFYRANGQPDDEPAWYPWSTVFGWDSNAGAFSHFMLPSEQPNPRPRIEWFNATPTRYHWYYKRGKVSEYTTGAWYPTDNADQTWLGKSLWRQVDRLPSHLPLSQRVRAAVNSMSPNGDCGAEWQFTQALALACVASNGVTDSLVWPKQPEGIGNIGDLIALEGWYRYTAKVAQQALSRLYAEKIPAVVVQNILNQRLSNGNTGGDYGKAVLDIGTGLTDVVKQWNSVTGLTFDITNAISAVRVSVDELNAENESALAGIAIQQLGAAKDMIEEAGRAVSSWGHTDSVPWVSGTATSVAAAAAIALDAAIEDKLDTVRKDEARKHADQVKLAFIGLENTINKDSLGIQNALLGISQGMSSVRSAQIGMQTARNATAYNVGKAAGLGVWQCGTAEDAQECTSHVNTVLNRRYAAFEQRYKAALRDAKALAYIARRAVEQRIGLRLTDITTRIGPLEAPSSWADDVCRLTGVDYKRLRTEESLDAGTTTERNAVNADEASEFADAFIGDYVEKLANFVQYYNIAFPAHEGDDTAVLSFRQDVLREGGSCKAPAYNLLKSSSHLSFTVPAGSTLRGWQHHRCADASPNCLTVASSPATGLPEGRGGGATWLASKATNNEPGTREVLNSDVIAAPDGLISQTVDLVPGHYVLSWWDRAADASGVATNAPIGPYRAGVYDSGWSSLNTFNGTPQVASDTTWGDRRSLELDVTATGTYHVAFGASLSPATTGSVVVANVQLEQVTTGSGASGYQDTTSTGLATNFACASTAETLRSSFKRSCDNDGTCYWELKRPLDIDTRKMTINGSPLVGKLAVGNFNFRHIDFAVNLVGTGLRDCSGNPSPDCFASGYLEYSLDHDADDVGILGYDNEVRVFDFGVATISHGKALAAERYITNPISSADSSLLQQAGILKPELRGRPIDGAYQLRVYDSPALRWEQLEDIQLVLKYRYWARIATPGQY